MRFDGGGLTGHGQGRDTCFGSTKLHAFAINDGPNRLRAQRVRIIWRVACGVRIVMESGLED
jgi:hypothetical protein